MRGQLIDIFLNRQPGASNFIAEIYDQLGFKSLGQISSIVFYGVFAFTALFSAKIMEGWSYKKSVFLGSVGYVFLLLLAS